MALFGAERDASLFRRISRELMGSVVSQQCIFYKLMLNETEFNMYGEAVGDKYFNNPLIINCFVDRNDQEFSTSEMGVDLNWNVTFAFLKDDLVDANLVPEVGDVIMYQEKYFETDSIIRNQLALGKDPDYPNNPNPLVSNLEKFGYDVSVVISTHQIPGDKLNIKKERF